MQQVCNVCFHHCQLNEGQTGFCHARAGVSKDMEERHPTDGSCGEKDAKQHLSDEIVVPGTTPLNYGHITSIALDPIEKKPLKHFHPGSQIVSVGSYGCNLKCPFCQNVSISLADDRRTAEYEYLSPEGLSEIAAEYVPYGNIGVAFTYNEPLICYEYVRDTAKLLKDRGLAAVVVTNGSVEPWVVEELGPYVDAMNIDLKSFQASYYDGVLKGSLDATKEFIRTALLYSHVELTTLVIPGENDSACEMEEIVAWISDLEREFEKKIPFHISRFFPRSQYADRTPTELSVMKRLYEIAKRRLTYVYLGNC